MANDDLLMREEPSGNLAELSVTELSSALKRTVEDRFGLVRVRGEIGRCTCHRSGHVYLSLKDDKAVIDGVIWKGVAQRLAVAPEEGMEVVVTGKLTTFPGQSKYQIVIDALEPAGAGALMAMLEARRKALTAEGLFAAERKKPLPSLPGVIGVITSPTGAVIRDILHRISERFPRHVLVWPVAVQGPKCAPEVVAAIRGFNALKADGAVPRPDLLIVARGGGSVEDLWGFNEEAVIRAVADSDIPVISAVGHETDITLVDHVADLRAPTPTAAAEKAVPVRAELAAILSDREARRLRAMERALSSRRDLLRQTGRALPRPRQMLGEVRQRLDLASDRLRQALSSGLQRRTTQFAQVKGRLGPAILSGQLREARAKLHPLGTALHRAQRQALTVRRDSLGQWQRTLTSLSYQRVLERGYAVVRNTETGALITHSRSAEAGAAISLEFGDGAAVPARIEGGSPEAVAPMTAPRRRKPKASPPSTSQPDLFGD